MADAEFQCDWEERLQDWIDGDLDSTEAAAIELHASSCTSCRERLTELRDLNARLSTHLAPVTLDATFDRKVLARIAVMAQADRAALRARLENERRDQMAALSRGWRRLWRSIILSAVAGISVLIALTQSFRMLPHPFSSLYGMLSLSQGLGASLASAVSIAAASTIVAITIVRVLAVEERG